MAELAYSFLKGNAVYKKGAQLCAPLSKSSRRIWLRPENQSPQTRKSRISGIDLATGYLPVPRRDEKKSGKSPRVN